jgi:hypothetical protein
MLTKHFRSELFDDSGIRARKEILRVILDLRFTITLVKRSPEAQSADDINEVRFLSFCRESK